MNQEDNIPCRFDFLKVEEVVSTLSQPQTLATIFLFLEGSYQPMLNWKEKPLSKGSWL